MLPVAKSINNAQINLAQAEPTFFTSFESDLEKQQMKGLKMTARQAEDPLASTQISHYQFLNLVRLNCGQKSRQSASSYHRVDQSVKKWSESNRMSSRQKIKNEETCFRYKLKMITILRQLKFPNAELEELQKMEPQNFILSFANKIKQYVKKIQKTHSYLEQKNKELSKLLQSKEEEINLLRAMMAEEKNSKMRQKTKSLLKQSDGYPNFQKDSTMEQIVTKADIKEMQKLQQQNSQLSTKIQLYVKMVEKLKAEVRDKNDLISSSFRSFHDPKPSEKVLQENVNEKLKIQYRKGKLDAFCQTEQKNQQKPMAEAAVQMQQLIAQWKNKLEITVDYYEKIMESNQSRLKQKDKQIHGLKGVVNKYIKTRLNWN